MGRIEHAGQAGLECLFERLKEFEDFFGGFLAYFSVADKGDSVGAFAVDHGGVAGEDRFDDLDLAEHGVDEEVGAGSFFDEELCDFSAAGVSGGADGGFEVAVGPIPDGVEDGRVFGEVFFDGVEVAVGDADELLDDGVGECGRAFLGLGHGGS